LAPLTAPRYRRLRRDLVAPVELVSPTRRESQRHINRRRRLPVRLAPPSGVAPHRIVAALLPAPAQFLEEANQRQLLTGRLAGIPGQQFVKGPPSSGPASAAAEALVSNENDVSPDRSTRRTVLRDTPRSRAISLIGLPLTKCSRNRLHNQHPPPPASNQSGKPGLATLKGGQFWAPIPRLRGSILHAECVWSRPTRDAVTNGERRIGRTPRTTAAQPGSPTSSAGASKTSPR
jgi:hypothetical protein